MQEPSHSRPALATGGPVVMVMVLHASLSTAIIQVVDPDVPDLVQYWLFSVLGPSVAWAALVVARAVVWQRASAFWLGASGGIVVLGAFLIALLIVIADISARGIPLALILSSWVLLACSIAVALVVRAVVGPARPEPEADEVRLDRLQEPAEQL